MVACPSIKLNNGQDIPVVGLGTFQSKENEVGNAVKEAIKAGYRHIDTAMIYFNEAEIGDAIKECISEGLVTREDLFITTKLWNDCHHPDDVEYACRESLERLGCDYLDLYLIHWPVANHRITRDGSPKKPGFDDSLHYVQTWKAMEKLVETGLVKSIGVSNFNVQQLSDILADCKIAPAINQIEVHARLQREELLDFCSVKGIAVQCYAPLGSPGNPAGVKSDCLSNETVAQIASAHKVTTAQVLLKFLIQRGFIVLPKSVTPQRIQANFDLFGFTLTDDEVTTLRGLNNGTVYFPLTSFRPSKFYPFPEDPVPE